MIVKDHNGREFKTVTAMCKHYGLKVNTYNWRVARGYPLDKALTSPVARRGWTLEGTRNFEHMKGGVCISVKDHLGKEHESFSAMCRAWEVTGSMVRNRLKRGFSLADALCTPRLVSGRPSKDFSKIETRRHHISRVVNLRSPDIQLLTRSWL